MNEVQVILNDGTELTFHGFTLTTHEHLGVNPSNDNLRKVLGNRDGYLAVVEKGGYPRSNMLRRIRSEEILDIRKDGQTVMYIPQYRDYYD